MRRLLAIALGIAVLAGGAAALAGAKDGSATGKSYKMIFDNGFGLVKGGDFRVGGVKAGQTTDFRATSSVPPKAEVTAKITQPGFDDLRKDASCEIRPQSLIGEYYVDCQPGSSPQKLPDGGVIPVKQTASTIPTDLVNNILRRPYRERLRLIIAELGTGLAGRPQDLQAVLKRSDPGLRETSKVLQILGRQNKVIRDFVRDADTSVAALEARKKDVSRFIKTAGDAAAASASRRVALAQTFNKLPRFLAELQPTMARLGDLADQQIPLLSDARRAAPSLDAFLARLGPLSQAARPAVRSLGNAAEIGSRATRKGRQEVAELRRLAADAPGLGKPLRQFLQSMDDRRRSATNDPRGLVNGPPASDPSQKYRRNGFTGLESIWNFVYWSGLSLNGFDKISHFLRVSVTATKCSNFQNDSLIAKPNDAALKQLYADCNQWLGPNQPGVTTPDYTTNGAVAASKARSRGATRAQGPAGGGQQLDSPPAPGKRDLSKPQVVLPPQVQDLIDKVTKGLGIKRTQDKVTGLLNGQGPRAQGGGAPSTTQLLDYLLAP